MSRWSFRWWMCLTYFSVSSMRRPLSSRKSIVSPLSSSNRLELVWGDPGDGRPHGIQMHPPGLGPKCQQSSLLAGHSRVLCLFLCLAEPFWLRTTRNAPDRFPSWDGLFRVVCRRPWPAASFWCRKWCRKSLRFRKNRAYWFAEVRQRAKSTDTLSVFVDCWIGRIKRLLD